MNFNFKIVPFISLFFVLFLNGCFLWTTRDDGELIKQDVAHLGDRLDKLEQDADKGRKELSSMIERAQKQVRDMEDTLSKATRVLARNSADFGAEMEDVKNELANSKGASAEIQNELEILKADIEKSNKKIVDVALAAGLDLPVDEESVPKTEAAHLDKIKSSFSKERYGETRSLAILYQNRYPKGKELDEVQLIVGKSYMLQKRYSKALGALRRFVDLFPKSKHNAEVLYEMGNAFFMLGDCTDANVLADTVLSRYSSSPFAEKSKKLKEEMVNRKARCTS